MLGANNQTVIWPQCGEIDIMELKGHQPSIICMEQFMAQVSRRKCNNRYFRLENNRFDKDFHIFAVEWDVDKIDFFVDGFLYNRITKSTVATKGEWVYDHPFYLILNIAVGGTFAGFPTSETSFPQKMTIDYVKVYKLAK